MVTTPRGDLRRAYGTFPAVAHGHLDRLRDRGAWLPAQEAEALGAALGADARETMVRLLPVAACYARAPISGFHVGAVTMGLPVPGGDWGAMYLGANLEVEGGAPSFGVHAEQSATLHAWLHGERGLAAIAISSAPCGHCRQFLRELSTAATLEVTLPDAPGPGGWATHRLDGLLPAAFGPEQLGVGAGLMDPRHERHTLSLASSDPLVRAALDAARCSWAPYTRNHAGVALELGDGTVHVGRCAESAAYHPGVPALQCAIALAHLGVDPGAPLEIRRAVLVEEPTRARQRAAAEVVLAACAPGVTLEYHEARAG